MQLSVTEENYLKEIYGLSKEGIKKIPNLQIGSRLGINPPTVTEMLRKLADKGLISYTRADGASLTEDGEVLALQVIRKHRLWETFLVNTLGFGWGEVHEVAEQLEHIRSQKLLDELDRFLGYPEYDPHGEPIPNPLGIMPVQRSFSLSSCLPGERIQLQSVGSQAPRFLQEMEEQGIRLRSRLEVKENSSESGKMALQLENGRIWHLLHSEAEGMMVTRSENKTF